MRPLPRTVFPLVLIVIAASTVATPAAAYQRPGDTVWLSARPDGAQAGGYSLEPYVSADGTTVAYFTEAPDIVAGDTNGQGDVVVADIASRSVERVSVSSDGTQAEFNSGGPTLSPDGRLVGFSSRATNLVPGDTNGAWDVFVHDRDTKITERISVASDGSQTTGTSDGPSFSADGRYVAYESFGETIVPGDSNGNRDIFRFDRVTRTVERVSITADGVQPNGICGPPSISADGRYVAFDSTATNLVTGDTNSTGDAFVKDMQTGVIERISLSDAGGQGNGSSGGPTISADGRHVAFSSAATNLVPQDTNGTGNPLGMGDVFVHDRVTRSTTRVSVSSDGVQASSVAGRPQIGPDGRYVAFQSGATNLVGDKTHTRNDIFLHDRHTGITERVSVNPDGTEARGGAFGASRGTVSAGGAAVAFSSDEPGIGTGDTGGLFDGDIFVRRRGPAVGVASLTASVSGGIVSVSGSATFTGATVSRADDARADALSGARDVGGELTAALVVFRPEREDLLVRWELAHLPSVAPGSAAPTTGGQPTVSYVLDLEAGGIDYRVVASTPNLFNLYRCDPACVQISSLTGGIGTVGAEARVGVPLAALGHPAALTGVRARTVTGEAISGQAPSLDVVALPDASLSRPTVEISLADGTRTLSAPASLSAGAFAGTLDARRTVEGAYTVTARACLGAICGAANTPVTLIGTGNAAPVLDAIGARSVVTGDPLEIVVSASDVDGDPLTYTASGLPRGATFDPVTKTMRWTPDVEQVGAHPPVRFEVGDGLATDSEEVQISVLDRIGDIVIATPAQGAALKASSVTVAGNTGPNLTVRLFEGDTAIGTVAADAAGAFSATFVFPDGAHTLTATATDAAGTSSPPSAPRTFTVDTVAPDAPAIISPAEGSTLMDSFAAVAGTAEPGAHIRLREGARIVASTYADTSGAWSTAAGFANGAHTLDAVATDAAGNPSASPSVRAFTVSDATAPAIPVIGTPAQSATVDASLVAIAGSAEPGAHVTVREGGVAIGTAPANAAGAWRLVVRDLPGGPHTVTASATDPAGNTGDASAPRGFTVIVTAPPPLAISSPAQDSVQPGIVAFSGSGAKPGGALALEEGGIRLGTVMPAADGSWTMGLRLPPGPHAVVARSASSVSQSIAFTVDADPPSVAVATAPRTLFLPGEVVRIVGAADDDRSVAAVTVSYFDQFNNQVAKQAATCACAPGARAVEWMSQPLLPTGSYTALAQSTDQAGNVSGLRTTTFIVL